MRVRLLLLGLAWLLPLSGPAAETPSLTLAEDGRALLPIVVSNKASEGTKQVAERAGRLPRRPAPAARGGGEGRPRVGRGIAAE
jgi:hypothetical protein